MKRTSTADSFLGVLFGLFCAISGAFILDRLLPANIVKVVPSWSIYLASWLIGYLFWIWIGSLYSVLFDALFDAVFGKSDETDAEQPEEPAERLPEDIERTYAALPTTRLEELLKDESELIPGAGELLRLELARRHRADSMDVK